MQLDRLVMERVLGSSDPTSSGPALMSAEQKHAGTACDQTAEADVETCTSDWMWTLFIHVEPPISNYILCHLNAFVYKRQAIPNCITFSSICFIFSPCLSYHTDVLPLTTRGNSSAIKYLSESGEQCIADILERVNTAKITRLEATLYKRIICLIAADA